METRNYVISADSIEEIRINNLSLGETTSVQYDYPVITHNRNKTTLLNSEYSEVMANEITAIAENTFLKPQHDDTHTCDEEYKSTTTSQQPINTTTITTEQQHDYTVSERHQEKLQCSQYSLVGPDKSTTVSGNQFHLQTSSSQSGNVNKELTNVSDDTDNSTQPSSDTSVQHDYENVIQTCIVNENTLIKSQYSLLMPNSSIVPETAFESGNVNKELTNVSDDTDNSTQPSSDTSVQHDYENVIQTCIVNENTLIKSQYSLLMPNSSIVPETAFESGNVNKELTNVSDDTDNSTQPSSDTSVQHDYENVIQTCIVNENTLIKSEYSLLMPNSSIVPETAFESLYEANNHVHTYDTACNDDAVVPPENSDSTSKLSSSTNNLAGPKNNSTKDIDIV